MYLRNFHGKSIAIITIIIFGPSLIVFASMPTAGRTSPVLSEPLLHVEKVATVRTGLTPNVQSFHNVVANAAQSVLRRMAPITEPTGSEEQLTALAAVRIEPR